MKEREQDDYYDILGLQPGLQGGTKASAVSIRKAYHARALACHPDKRPNDPHAASEFQLIQRAYEVLGDHKARSAYDELLNIKRIRLERENQQNSKRQKMMQDLRDREWAFDLQQKEKEAEDRAAKRFKEELARIRAMHAQKTKFGMFFNPKVPDTAKCSKNDVQKASNVGTVDKDRILKVTWQSMDGGNGDYTAAKLKEIFQQFGTVEDVVIRPRTAMKKSSAMVVLGSKLEVIAATRTQCGELSNPLLVVPLVSHGNASRDNVGFQMAEEAKGTPIVDSGLDTIVGPGYHAYEDAVLKKMQKKAEQDRMKN
eukprot:c21878_g1_i1 orf=328-1266(-)